MNETARTAVTALRFGVVLGAMCVGGFWIALTVEHGVWQVGGLVSACLLSLSTLALIFRPLESDERRAGGSADAAARPSNPDPAMPDTCCARSAIVLDFTERTTYRRCPVHGETEHIYQPPHRLTLRRRWQLRQSRRRLRRSA